MDAKGVLEFAKKHGAKILDLRFIDVPGIWQHVSYPIGELSEDSFKEGFGFDASSIRGWASIHESDMLLMPDPNTAFMDPFLTIPRSAPRREARRRLPEIDGLRGHGVLRRRGRIFHL
jgi:glutamine synthetase